MPVVGWLASARSSPVGTSIATSAAVPAIRRRALSAARCIGRLIVVRTPAAACSAPTS
jgi:hypothetical protein